MLFGTGQRGPGPKAWRPADVEPRDYAAARAGYRAPIVSTFAAASSAGSTSQRPAYRNLTIDFGASISGQLFEIPGRFIWFHEWSQITGVYLYLQFNDAGADRIIMRPGKALAGIPFERLFITAPTFPGVSGELLVLPESPENLAQRERDR